MELLVPACLYSHDQRGQIAELREAGLLYREIAARIGCSSSTVYRVCLISAAEQGDPPPFRRYVPETAVVQRNGHVVRRFGPEEDARLLALEAESKSYTEIGRALGRKPHSVGSRLLTLARHQAWAEAA